MSVSMRSLNIIMTNVLELGFSDIHSPYGVHAGKELSKRHCTQ